MKWYFPPAVLALAGMWIACERETVQTQAEADGRSHEELVKRGEYLVTTSGCHDCHSPKKMTDRGPVPDPDLLLSGHPSTVKLAQFDPALIENWVLFHPQLTAAAGPWGVSFAANLTSDESGVGNWTEEHFFTAIRKGKHKGLMEGRNILPPMPWEVFRNMTDEDLSAIFAYLQSTKPVRNIVPEPVPPASGAVIN